MNSKLYLGGIMLLLFLATGCAKKCECTLLDPDGNLTEEIIEEHIPHGIEVDCSFFESRLDTAKKYRCQ